MKNDATIQELLPWAEKIIQQTQYEGLDSLPPATEYAGDGAVEAGEVACLFRVNELVFSRTEGSAAKFTTVLNALHACGATCLMLLQCQNGHSELYIGAVNKRRYDNVYFLNTIRDVLRVGMEGNLPGTDLEEVVSRQEIEDKLIQCVDNGFDSQCITAISCVPGDGDDSAASPNGIERLLEAVGNKNFSIMVLADPVEPEEIKSIRRGYEDLGTQLSGLEQSSLSLQTGTSTTLSENYSQSFSQTLGKNISLTQSHTTGTGWSSAKDDNQGKNHKLLAAGTGLLTQSYIAMNAVSMLINRPQASESGHDDFSTGMQIGENMGIQEGQQKGEGKSVADSVGETVSATTKDYHVSSLLERVNWYIQWINRRENYGMFNSCTYVISSSASINLMVASQYQALMQGNRDMSQPVTINTWSQENGAGDVRKALMHLTHPSFECRDLSEKFTPAMLLSSKELSRQMALPQKPVVGISVSEYAAFGREVVRKTPIKNGKVIRVGSVSHMGKTVEKQPVILDLQSMAAHTFIAGTNGSGKSNAVFKILEELLNVRIPFLVIEPAKGEYKNVFGHDRNVHVYGTNKKRTPLLRLNPFWFNDDVHVLEHIDKLIDVFNASWSMYAAMPAVLKASIENAYLACGWNLTESICLGKERVFPTVKDVLAEFNTKMESTAFSQEVKGNYVGALSSRMESLCNGVFGEIFCGENLSDEELFDQNVIIDLSRVGSVETKSMLMGILVIRLQEYRMNFEAMNLPLKHVTVLEEAHHLLRETSFAQSGEGANLLGKSVEMISNAIAEMRSYGEGFIIVDQSPGLLDMSVMRNTNTKMILRLPEAGDRERVGNTMGLTREQIYEISRFKTGVCAIYQKDWLEAVLCQVDKASREEMIYSYQPPEEAVGTSLEQLAEYRGMAFCAICPLDFQPAPLDETARSQLETVCECLTKSDCELAKLLRLYLDEGIIRERGSLQPYLSVLWDSVNGQRIWKRTSDMISGMETARWDKEARSLLRYYVKVDYDTETSLLSLFLQGKGSGVPVRRFYHVWFNEAMKKRSNREKTPLFRTKNSTLSAKNEHSGQ